MLALPSILRTGDMSTDFLAKQICHGAYVQAFPDDRNIQKKPFQNYVFFLSTGLYSEETNILEMWAI